MIYYFIVAMIVLFDQVTKYWAQNTLAAVGSMPVIDGVFHWTYARNTGAAFSILRDKQLLLIMVTILVTVFITGILVRTINTDAHVAAKLSLAFIIGGAIGNLIDRIRLDYVIDFADFRLINFAIFNVADSFVVVGAVLLVFAVIFKGYEF